MVLCDGLGQNSYITGWVGDYHISTRELRAMLLNEHNLPLKAREARGGLMPTKPYVLVVEDINQYWIRLLGAAVDLDPAFLSQYLNPRYPLSWLGVSGRRIRNPHKGTRAEVPDYDPHHFAEQLRADVEQKRGYASEATNDQGLPCEYADSSHVSGTCSSDPFLPLNAGVHWPSAGTGRVGQSQELARLWVACHRSSAHACKCLPLLPCKRSSSPH